MVGVDDQHGVLPEIILVHPVQHLAQVVVAHAHHSPVFVDDVLDLLFRLSAVADPDILGPVEEAAVIFLFIQGHEAVGDIVGLVGIKLLQLQKPVVGAEVLVNELQAVLEVLGDGDVLLLGGVVTVDVLLAAAVVLPAVQVLGHVEIHPALPGIALGAPGVLEGVVLGLIVGTALLPVVPVVRYQVRIDAVLLEQLGHGVVIELNGTPAPVQEVVPAGVNFPPGRHAGQTSGVEVVEGGGMFRQTLEVGRHDVQPAVGRQHDAVEGIKHDHNGFHKGTNLLILRRCLRCRLADGHAGRQTSRPGSSPDRGTDPAAGTERCRR